MNQITIDRREPLTYRERLFAKDVLSNPPDHIIHSEAKNLADDGIPRLFSDIDWLQTLISTVEPGKYTAKQIFDAWWGTCRRPRSYGKYFKEFVVDGKLGNIRLLGKRTDGSLEYEVYG